VLNLMPDTRPMRCRDHAYEFTRLETADVKVSIVSQFSGRDDVERIKTTLTSIVLHTPYDLYEEIVVIDDGTEDTEAQHAFGTFLQDSRFNKVSPLILLPYLLTYFYSRLKTLFFTTLFLHSLSGSFLTAFTDLITCTEIMGTLAFVSFSFLFVLCCFWLRVLDQVKHTQLFSPC